MTPARLEDLARDLAAMPVAGDAMPFSLPEGVSREGDDPFVLRFDPPIDAKMIVAAFGWARAYACSGDVHRRSWHIELFGEDRPDRFNLRISSLARHRRTTSRATRPA
jgi:hypothetical protein